MELLSQVWGGGGPCGASALLGPVFIRFAASCDRRADAVRQGCMICCEKGAFRQIVEKDVHQAVPLDLRDR
jgi:hypothetical protein